MVEKLAIEIVLEGGAELQQQFKAATSSIAKLGSTAEEAFAGASAAAQKFSATTQQLGQVEGVIKALAARARDSGTSFAQLAENYDRARQSAAALVPAAAKVEQAIQKTGNTATETRNEFRALAEALNLMGAGPLGRIATALANIGTRFGALAAATAAVGGTTAALIKFAVTAEESEKALTQLQKASGESFSSLSALANVFAQGGTPLKQFAAEFGKLALQIAEASRTMADDIEQSSQRIKQANQAEAQSALGLENAELNLFKIQVARNEARTGRADPVARRNIAYRQAALQLAQAEAAVAAAQLAQEKAAHDAKVAEANDLTKNIKLYQQMGQGKKVAFDPLTTQATKNQALLAALAQAGNNWKSVLADILKSATELERIQIGKALGLSPETLTTLSQGSERIKELQAEAARLGLTLTSANQQALQEMAQAWNQFTALLSAMFEKIGAIASPAFTTFIKIMKQVMEQIVADFQNLPLDEAIANLGSRLTPAFWALVDLLSPIATAIGEAILKSFKEALYPKTSLWDAIKNDFIDFGESIVINARILGEKIRRLLSPDSGGGAAPPANGGPRFAGGGFIGGRGTGTSDSNLAWVSRGEHIMPARAVAQPGVLAFLEALRRSGGNLSRVLDSMSHFAMGGMVPRAMPAFAAGGLAGGSNVTIAFPGLPPISGLRASSDVVEQLHRAAALAQVRSGGRKPSRYA